MANQHNTFADQLQRGFSQKFNFKTVLALVIFGMIIVVFVFSGMMGRNSSLGTGVAATVNGDIISVRQFQEQENRVASYYSQMLGGQFENLIQRKQLQVEALNQLVDNSVAAQSAERENIYATNTGVRLTIQDMPYFKKDGVFQTDLYRGVLASNNLNPGDFEKMIRQQITIQKVRDIFEASTVLTQLEKNLESDLKRAKMNVLYLKISPETQKTPENALKLAQEIEAEMTKSLDQKSLESFLASKGLKLKETGPFEISSEVAPGINSPAVFKAAFELTPEKPVAKNLVKEGDAHYLVILKSKTYDSVADIKSDIKRDEMMDKQKSYLQYQRWLDNNKRIFTINRNAQLIQ